MSAATPRSAVAFVLAVVLTIGHAAPARAYLKYGYAVNGQSKTLSWSQQPVSYYISDSASRDVTPTDLQAAVAKAFATWEAVPSSDIAFRFSGYTSNLPGDDDGRSTIGFLNEPALDRVLASTSYLIDGLTGELLEADIFFNAAFSWSTDANGEAGHWDVQTIALHEIGHLSGLGHSALGETTIVTGGRRVLSTGSVMFPIALGLGDISGRVLQPDDVAGISDLYPSKNFNTTTGSVSGRVTKSGSGVFGAHVVAFDPATGAQVGNFTLNASGRFSIAGLRPGPHLLRVEPLDDADIESFFGEDQPVGLDFKIMYLPRLVVVPKGGDSGTIEIVVSGK